MVGVADNEAPKTIEFLPLDQISSNPFKPRKSIGSETIDRLADSIEKFGQIHPLTITPMENHDRYHLISGERRLEALQELDRSEAPCLIRHLSERELIEISLAENTHREPISLIDELEACQRIMKRMEFSSLERVAHKFFNGRAGELLEFKWLLQLGEVGREAFRKRLITTEQAEILNEFNEELQEEIVKQYRGEKNFKESVLEVGLPYPEQSVEGESAMKPFKSDLIEDYLAMDNPFSVSESGEYVNKPIEMLPAEAKNGAGGDTDNEALPI